MLKSSSSAAAKRSHSPSGAGSEGLRKTSRRLAARASAARQRLVRVVDRLRPVRGHEEDEQRLAPPPVERVAHRRDVALGLGHLLAGEAEHPVVRPQLRERMPERARLGDLVLVVREDEVEPAAVDLERRAEQLLGHHRALDVPAGPAASPRRVPRRVLARLVRLPQREVARILLARVRLLLLDLLRPLPRELSVLGELRDAVVDVAVDLVRVTALDQLLDRGDDLRNQLARLRLLVGHAETEVRCVLEVPLRRARGELGTRTRRGVVDLVVDVRDVVDERRVVAALGEPAAEPHADRRTAVRFRCAPARRRSGRRSTSGSGRASPAGPASTACTCHTAASSLSLDRDSQEPLSSFLGSSV